MCAGDETCISGQCVQAPAPECGAGETRCQPDSTAILQYCGEQGQWQSEACANGAACIDGACVAPECASGQARCNGNMLQDCEGGKWADYTDCAALNATCSLMNGNSFCKEAAKPAPSPEPKPSPAKENGPDGALLLAAALAVIAVGAAAYYVGKKKK